MSRNHTFPFWLALLVLFGIATGASGQDQSAQVMQRAVARYGNGFVTGAVLDSISEGKITLYTADGPKGTFDVTVLRKGTQKIQRIIKQPAGHVSEGSDGLRKWNAIAGGVSIEAQGPALRFIESQTVRSVHTLLNHRSEALTLHDAGTNGAARVIEAHDRAGRTTSYFVDNATSTITKLQFVVGQSTDPFSKAILADVETYLFSDFRVVQGLLTPFRIQRYLNALKIEEIQFTTVRYNASVDDKAFQP